MEKIINLDPNFSTVRMLTKTQSVVRDKLESKKLKSLLFLPPNPKRQGEGGLRNKGYFKHSYDTESQITKEKNLLSIPLVTIITVVFDGDKYLEQAIQSVINQTYDNIEYIIIDGGSTDGTIDIIRKYEQVIDYWISEPDRGLYDAMNKGICLSSGDIIGILNSDDLYLIDTVEKVVEKYKEDGKPSVIYGDMLKFLNENYAQVSFHKGDLSEVAFREFRIAINHPTCFVHREIYNSFGVFQSKYEVGADRELMMRFYEGGVQFIYLGKVLAKFRLGGTTSSLSLISIVRRQIIQENELMSEHNISGISSTKRYFIILRTVLKNLRIWILYKIVGERLAQHIIMFYLSQKFIAE
jgi:glycosyltransferase involved in cell wall biosynthesis